MIYLDANFYVFALLDTGTKGLNASRIQESIVEGREAVTSVLSLDELMWILIKNRRRELIRRAIEGIYATPNLTVREVDSDVPLFALDFMEKYDLKPRDAFHVAVMKSLGVNEIVSDDPDFDRIEWIKRIKI
ncbi:MAG: type II toxin-antitoxin system VapC family toxin [Candidatus Bathyarchaeia archaeon]